MQSRKDRSGRPSKVSDQQLKDLLNAKKDVQNQSYEYQMKQAEIHRHSKTLNHALKHQTRNAQNFRMKKVSEISPANKKKQVKYKHEHVDKTLENY